MKLKDKTYKKFVIFFERTAKKHDENEFEIAYSEIQRETGVASITLKKAIQVMEKDGIVEVSPGRNTRYGRFRYLLNKPESSSNELSGKNRDNSEEASIESLSLQIKSMMTTIEQLRQRVRTQEMSISVIQDRIAEIEDNNV